MQVEAWHYSLLILPPLFALHLFLSPYTKVEESFNIQAAHDILTYGVPSSHAAVKINTYYDHMTFRGAVPRTFVGALVLAGLSKPLGWLNNYDLPSQQYAVRGVLGVLNALALVVYARAVQRAYGKTALMWFCVLSASQFHIPYYASRTLPNMFAFGMSTVAQAFLLPDPTSSMPFAKRLRLALYLLTLATIVFRSELALLLGSICLQLLLKAFAAGRTLSFIRSAILPPILTATVVGLALTVWVDTFFWQSPRWLWPELAAFLANIFPPPGFQGASAWGISPWHWYFTSAIPRLLLNPFLLLLITYGLTTTMASSMLDLLFPILTYTATYSLLPHKETRFLFPILPPLTTALALPASYLTTHRTKSTWHKLTTSLLILTTALTAFLSHTLLLPLSAQTYPGATALLSVHSIAHTTSMTRLPHPRQIHVHLTNLALQTGVTRFLQHPPPTSPLVVLPGSADGKYPELRSGSTEWIYDKSDNATGVYLDEKGFWDRFDYVVVEGVEDALPVGGWDVVDKVPGLGGLGSVRVVGPGVGRGLLVLDPEEDHEGGSEGGGKREADGLMRLIEAVYGRWAGKVYGIVHDVLREGWGVRQLLGKEWSWTKGWWVHWGLEWKLYVLKRSEK